MAALIIDGKKIAGEIRAVLKSQADAFNQVNGRRPGLAVVLVGDDPASEVYVRNKVKACEEAGFYSEKHRLSSSASQKDVMLKVAELNANKLIDGLLVQFPLPKGLDEDAVQLAIAPQKDVDGLNPESVGALWSGKKGMVSCTPAGCIQLLKSAGVPLVGAKAVVVGRSNLVGKPIAALLLNENCTVTLCHSRSKDLAGEVKQADIVIAAVGKPKMITADMIKAGAAVIDVGINRGTDGKLVGDVDFEAVSQIASWITPVPGGVGPMTIAMLLTNTLSAAQAQVKG